VHWGERVENEEEERKSEEEEGMGAMACRCDIGDRLSCSWRVPVASY